MSTYERTNVFYNENLKLFCFENTTKVFSYIVISHTLFALHYFDVIKVAYLPNSLTACKNKSKKKYSAFYMLIIYVNLFFSFLFNSR